MWPYFPQFSNVLSPTSRNPMMRTPPINPGGATPPATRPRTISATAPPLDQIAAQGSRPRYADPVAGARNQYLNDTVWGQPDKYKGFWGHMKSGLKPALLGFLQGAAANPADALMSGLGGAATGFGIGAMSPETGREYEFEVTQRPLIEAEMERERQLKARGMDEAMQRAKLEGEQADVDFTRARTQATAAGMKDSEMVRRLQDADIRKREAEIKVLQARDEAIRTGKPTYRDIALEDGSVHTFQVFPDGSMSDLGPSGRAATAQAGLESRERVAGQQIQSREKIAGGQNQTRLQAEGMRQSGATGRTQMQESGRDRRATAPAAGGLAKPRATVSMDAVRAYAAEKGISEQEALSRFRARGLNVQ